MKIRGFLWLAVGVFLLVLATGNGPKVIKAIQSHAGKPSSALEQGTAPPSLAGPVTTISAAAAIAYAKAQFGKPYLWGGAGPDAFDCSGLVMMAYKLPFSLRTSEEQWAGLPHVDNPKPGDLVFFHGLLVGGESPPGHVGIVVGPHEMIDAYAVGYPVEYDSFGTAGSKQGLAVVWGYASP